MPTKWFKRVEIKNFESHKHTQVEFHPGINVLIGPSDSGKSSFLRAISWLCYNNIDDGSIKDSIRKDPERTAAEENKSQEFECSVKLELSDGTIIKRIRGLTTSNNKYTMQKPGEKEQTFTNFKQGVPSEIEDALGFKAYPLAGKNKLVANYLSQHARPMALAYSEADLSRILNLSNNLDCFDEVHQALRSKTHGQGELSQTSKIILQRIEEQENEYESLEDPTEKLEFLETLKSTDILKLSKLETDISEAERIINSHKDLADQESSLIISLKKDKALATFDLNKIAKKAQDINVASELITSYAKLVKDYRDITNELQKYERIADIDPKALVKSCLDIEAAQEIISSFSKTVEDCKALEIERQDGFNLISDLNKKISTVTNEIVESIDCECGFCLMCGAKTDEESRKKIRTYLEGER